jgi:hypothetical protein
MLLNTQNLILNILAIITMIAISILVFVFGIKSFRIIAHVGALIK